MKILRKILEKFGINVEVLRQDKNFEIYCENFLFLAEKFFANSGISWGSQNVAKDIEGPFTGEVSVTMLTDFSSQYAIIGHSERNTAYCESDLNIAEKFKRLKDHHVRPILCVGETLIEREAGMEKKVVQAQLETILSNGPEIFTDSVVAYEPIWAIGSDMAASPEQAQNMCSFIKDFIHSEVLTNGHDDEKKIRLYSHGQRNFILKHYPTFIVNFIIFYVLCYCRGKLMIQGWKFYPLSDCPWQVKSYNPKF